MEHLLIRENNCANWNRSVVKGVMVLTNPRRQTSVRTQSNTVVENVSRTPQAGSTKNGLTLYQMTKFFLPVSIENIGRRQCKCDSYVISQI